MIIGRSREKKLLEKAYASKTAEFITIYGRRRVGKTFLVSEFFKDKKCYFLHVAGLQDGSMEAQLEKFTEAFSQTFFRGASLAPMKKWDEALAKLHQEIELIEQSNPTQKIVIFLDELPWLATRRSGLMQEITYYWNKFWARMPQVIFIVCGSSASWLIQKIIYNKGGLHNRTTLEIPLQPFTLAETKDYLIYKEVRLTDNHIVDIYMALGGIPYYLDYIDAGKTAQENIQKLFFAKGAPLKGEFNKLFDSLFENADAYKELVRLISQKNEGVGREELKKSASLSVGGGYFSKRLQDLCDAGFIKKYVPWKRTVGDYYKLIDEFCIFYLRWVETPSAEEFTRDQWLKQSHRPAYYAWAGYSFEAVCYKHSEEIIHGLDIRTAEKIGSWRFVPRKHAGEDGAQVDLVIDRSDNAITLVEIKYTDKPFAVDKQYAARLQRITTLFKQKTKTTKQIFWAMVSAHGIVKTLYSQEFISAVATLEDLFWHED